jgi:hypothetical protein
MKIEKEGVITGFQGGINIYVDKGHSMKVFKSLNQLTYGELKVGDSYLVDASYGANAVDNLKKYSNGKITSLKKKFKYN